MIRILVIDDVLLVRNFITKTLEGSGYSVCSVGSGNDGLQVVVDETFDLVICDLNLPDISGVDFVQRMSEKHPDVPCIILTGAATKESIQALKSCPNLKAYLVKPVDRNRLLAEARRILNG